LLSKDVQIVGNRIKVNVFDFKEQEHPRAKGGKKGGQFVKKGTSGGSSSSKSEKPESFKGQKFLGSKLADLSEERHGNLQNKNFYNAKLDFNETDSVKLDNSNFKKSVIKNLNDVKSAKGADFTKAKFYNDYDDYDNFEYDIKKGKFDNASFQGVDLTPLLGEEGNIINFISLAEKKNINIKNASFQGEKLKGKKLKVIKSTAEVRKALFENRKPALNKKKVNSSLIKETKLDKKYVRNSIDEWASTSANESFGAILTQMVAKKMFNLKSAAVDHFEKEILEDIEKEELYSGKKERLLKAQYDLTQKLFKKLEYKANDVISLYRGVDLGHGGIKKMKLQPLSSFSFDRSTAEGFGDELIEAIVPVKCIFSTPLTGFGCTAEEECIILGSKYMKFKKVRGSYDNDEEVNIDAKVSNADWLKRTWDLPPYGSKEFFEVLKQMHITLDHFKTLPVYKYYIQNKKGK